MMSPFAEATFPRVEHMGSPSARMQSDGYPCDWLISRYGRFRRWRIRSALGLQLEFRGR